MGQEQPFLYDHPARYSFNGPAEKGFNPKAALQASWAPRQSRQKPEGPLINAKEINRHPDSYFIIPYGNLDWKPMSPRTKTNVKYLRRFQLLLRAVALLGALGMLVCVICIKGTNSTLGWIIRIPPGVATLHTLYAIYHLARPSKARTPASSSSYMLFAAMVDAGLIPFLVFTAMMARAQYTQPGSTPEAWSTLFNDDQDTYKIVFSTFLFSVVNGSIHLISLTLSIYLAMIFRRISKLPPDMNPLEDNLTSRHKRNKSSLSTIPIDFRGKRDSQVSAPLMESPRTVPFMHTRTDSSTNLTSPQRRPISSNNTSRVDLTSPLYQQQASNRTSRADLPSPPKSPTKRTSTYTDYSRPTSTRPPSTRPNSTKPSSALPQSVDSSLLNDNWVTYPSPSTSPQPISRPTQNHPELRHLRVTNPVSRSLTGNFSFTRDSENLVPKPLEMKPPTPPNPSFSRGKRALTPLSGNVDSSDRAWYVEDVSSHVYPSDKQSRPSSARQDSFGTVGGKARYYGEMYGGKVMEPRQSRIVSSGRDAGLNNHGMRAREVSGKIMEEGRGLHAGIAY